VCADTESAEKSITDLHQELFMNSHIRVKKLRISETTPKKATLKVNFTETVMVSNLPAIVNEKEIRDHFSKVGNIQNVRLMSDPKTFIGKGFGYILFEDEPTMLKAIKTMHNLPFKGRNLVVKQSVEKKPDAEPKMKNAMR